MVLVDEVVDGGRGRANETFPIAKMIALVTGSNFLVPQYTISEHFARSSRSWHRPGKHKSLHSLTSTLSAVRESRNTDIFSSCRLKTVLSTLNRELGP
jgi:hypothetical protein